MTTSYVPQTVAATMARIAAGIDPWVTRVNTAGLRLADHLERRSGAATRLDSGVG